MSSVNIYNFVFFNYRIMDITTIRTKGKVFGYARVSTREQNLDMQLDILQKHGCLKIFCEKKSGIKKRPELEQCLSILKEGDILVVYKLDRLARSLSEIVRICSELENRKVRIKSVKDNIDTTDYMGKFTMHIFAALAEFERNVILERTREGREAALKRGRIFGRPKGLSKQALEKVKKTADMYRSGYPIKLICTKLDIQSKSTVYKYLRLGKIPLKSESRN